MAEIEHLQTLSQPQILLLIWLSTSLVGLMLIGRFGVRLCHQGRLLCDDYLLLLAFAIVVIMGAMHTLSLPPLFALRQGEAPPPSSMIQFLKVQFIARILFWSNFYMVKASLLAFLRTFLHALPSSRKYWCLSVIAIVIGALGSLVGNMTECTPFWRNFSITESCSGPAYLQTSRVILTCLTAWDIFTDVIIVILPLPLLLSLRRTLTKAQLASLGPVFGSGALIIIFAILRLQRIWRNRPIQDLPWQITIAITWSHIEAAVAIFVGTLPAFKVLFTSRSGTSCDGPRGRGQIGSLRSWTDDTETYHPTIGTTETGVSNGKSTDLVIAERECR